MNIQVRVLSTQAQARIRQLELELAALQRQANLTGTSMNKMGTYGLPYLSKWGNQVQWAGRQLQYNFTLPILLATGAAVKFALDNEKAMTRVIKVYGDGTKVFRKLSKTEIPALEKAFESLSNTFGVARADVIGIAGDWAAAGASGVALAKSVKLTLETMILGEMEAVEATQALIAIQAQYGYSTEQLTKVIDVLNMTENQTGISMQGLVQGFARAAGVARSAGVDVEHLAAMLAALTPAAGSAAQAGNGLKTMISRLLAPTKEATQVMALMGVNTDEVGWKSLNASQRLELMATKFDGLADAQKAVVSSVIASRYQINRFDVLMRDIINRNGYYQKSLKATSDEQRNFQQRVKELNVVLESNPQKLKQVWVILQNAMADVVVPLIPYIVYLAQQVAKMMNEFAQIDPTTQKAVLALLLLLAAIGPIARYIGSIANLTGLMTATFHFFAAKLAWVGKTIYKFTLGPIVSLITWLATSLAAAALWAVKFPATMIAGITTAASGTMARLTLWRSAMGAWWASTKLLWIGNLLFLQVIGTRFWASLQVIWGAGAVATTSIWTRLWATMVLVQRAGFAAIMALSGKMAMLVSLFAYIGRAIQIAWVATWTGLAAIQTIWSARMTAISILFATGQIGIFGRLGRMLAVTWTATVAAMLTIWRTGLRGWMILFTTSFKQVSVALLRFGKWFVSWPVALFFAVLGITYTFRDQLIAAWRAVVDYFTDSQGAFANAMRGVIDIFRAAIEWIQDAFWSLPESVRNAFIAVVNIVKQAAMAVYNLFSYLNPFARHSPSLVESVTRGVAVIQKEFGKLKGVGALFAQVAKDLAAFKRIAGSMGNAPWQEERVDVAKAYKQALPLFDRLVKDWKNLNATLDRQREKVEAQQGVVDKWAAKLERANAALDVEQRKLDDLNDKLSNLTDRYQKHQDALSAYANAPLKGMRAMDDAIFSNEMAQKKLRLEMLRWEKQNGSIDDARKKVDALHGAIEMMQGELAGLRSGGAGSEITGPLKDQIKAMEDQAAAMTTAVNNSPMAKMQDELDELALRAEELDLEKSLQFDPLLRQIDQMVNATKELTFEEIVAGIKDEQAALALLQPKIDAVTAAIKDQQAVVDEATKTRDAVQLQYDIEVAKLDRMTQAMNATEEAIRSVEDALRQMGQAAAEQVAKLEELAAKAKDKKKGAGASAEAISPGAQNFMDAAGGNFPDVGGQAKIGREGGFGDQSKMIEEFTQGLADDLAKTFGSFDIFAPLKKAWDRAVEWVKSHVDIDMGAVRDKVGGWMDTLGNIENPFSGDSKFAKGFQTLKDIVIDVFKTIGKWFGSIADLLGPDVKKIFDEIVKAGKKVWTELGPELAKFGELWPKFTEALGNVWNILKPIIAILGGAFLLALEIVAQVLSNVIGPAFDLIIQVIKGFIQVIRGIVEVFIGVFTLDLPMILQGFQDIFGGIWTAIWGILENAGKILWGIVKGIVEGIVDFFVWLYDELVGHSIVPDMVDAILGAFDPLLKLAKWIWDNVLKPIKDFFVALWKDHVKPELAKWWENIKAVWNNLVQAGQWVWNHILKPVFDEYRDLWTVHVQPKLAAWWENIKGVWNNLLQAGAWVWNNILQPVFQTYKDLWTLHVQPKLAEWWENIKDVWNSLTKLGGWVQTNVLDPVKNAFTSTWHAIKQWFIDNKDLFSNPIRNIVNAAIDGVNALIRGINKISDVLPGIDFSIELIPRLEKGGNIPSRQVGSGFMTNGARAIVGEGRRNHPEFVIPTDPAYRSRSIMLLHQAAKRIGITSAGVGNPGGEMDSARKAMAGQPTRTNFDGVPMYGIGGVIGWVKDQVGDGLNAGADWIVNSGRDMASFLADPFFDLGRSLLDQVGWVVPREVGKYGLNEAQAWIDGVDSAFNDIVKDSLGGPGIQNAIAFAKSQVGKRYQWGGVGPDGYDCSGFMSALTNVIRGQNPYRRVGATGTFPWAGFTPGVGPRGAFTIGSSPSYAGGIGHMAGTLGGLNVESAGGVGVRVGPQARGYGDPGFSEHGFLAMKEGGIALRRRGGSHILAGDGRYDEAVVPLPHGWNIPGGVSDNGTGSKTYIFNGNLEFPNITSGEDAKSFLDNLDNMTKD
jgi:TP901 family phage tail tape measure protein